MFVQPQPTPGFNYLGVPVIKIAGIEWFVPTLALRQTRTIIPAMARLLPVLDRLKIDPTGLTEDDLDLLLKLVHLALTRAYPGLQYEQLLDAQITLQEMTEAIPIIAVQAQIFRPSTAPPTTDASAPLPEEAAA